MATLIHLCRKDFAFARNGLFGAWAVFLAAALVPLVITGALVEAAAPILGLLLAVQYFQIFAATLKILRADSYSGGDAFIGTRPVTRNTLWLSKVLSITAFVLVPWLLVKAFGVIALRLQLTPGDWLLYIIETTLVFGIPASIAWIVGTHTRGFIGSTVLTMVLAALVLWLAVAIFNRPGGFQFV
ncbi:MAG: ABC-2 transporter permease, partial [Verrucomicrobiae bacterium]|nr:ABC-2 transporter permease [Verrucomicrobiae bacterium]